MPRPRGRPDRPEDHRPAARRVLRHPHSAGRRRSPSSRSPAGRRTSLIAVARGRTNPEIADELHISLSTVKTHLASIMAKLGARNRVEIVMWAYETDRVTS